MKLKKKRKSKAKPIWLGGTGWQELEVMSDRDLTKVLTSTCQCGEPIINFRTKCTDCIKKEVRRSIGAHVRAMPMSVIRTTNHEQAIVKLQF